MAFGKINSEAYQKFYQQEQENAPGDSKNWLKLSVGTYTLRITPPWNEEGLPFRKRVNHNDYVNPDGRRCSPLCLDYVFSTPGTAQYLVQKNLLSRKDYDSWSKHKCPMCQLATAIKALGRKDPVAYNLFPKTAYMWNVINRGQRTEEFPGGRLFKWNTSKKFFDAVQAQFGVYPDLFDELKGFDFMLTATGENMQRRYSAPTFIPSPSALNYDGEPYDLNDALAVGVKTFMEILECMAVTPAVAPLLLQAGIDVKQFLK